MLLLQKTGIRYGVIPANDVGQAWFDDSEAIGTHFILFHSPIIVYCEGAFQFGGQIAHIRKKGVWWGGKATPPYTRT